MKKLYFILLILTLGRFQATAQEKKPLTVDLRADKHDVIYLDFDTESKKLIHLIRRSDVDAGKDVHSEANQINIYRKWLNPLKYKLAWSDEIADDPRDVTLKEFLNLYLSPFGATLPSEKAEGKKGLQKVPPPPAAVADPITLLDGFHSADLNDLYIELTGDQVKIGKGMDALKELTEALKTLDDEHASAPFKSTIGTAFSALYKAKKASDAETVYDYQKGEVDKLPEIMDTHTATITNVEFLLKRTHLDDALLNSALHAKLAHFLEECKATIAAGKALKDKIDPIFLTFEKSLSQKTAQSDAVDQYFERSVTFADGKILKSKLGIKEIKIDVSKMEVSSETEIYSADFIFQRYESVKFFMSSGVFYSRTSLPGYGIADKSGVQTVVQDDLPAKQAVTAVFGNFMFDIFKSRYFVPTAQLGVDPTKKRPFVLAGGGFTIPAAKLALTGGVVWTWTPSLKTLKVDGPVSSTVALEKDITYEFDPGPKGFYIGLQYNF
jgi:hypothetical protein